MAAHTAVSAMVAIANVLTRWGHRWVRCSHKKGKGRSTIAITVAVRAPSKVARQAMPARWVVSGRHHHRPWRAGVASQLSIIIGSSMALTNSALPDRALGRW